MNDKEVLTIPENERPLLADLSIDLSSHLLENNSLSDPSESQVIAASFIVEQYKKGWRFSKCQLDIEGE